MPHLQCLDTYDISSKHLKDFAEVRECIFYVSGFGLTKAMRIMGTCDCASVYSHEENYVLHHAGTLCTKTVWWPQSQAQAAEERPDTTTRGENTSDRMHAQKCEYIQHADAILITIFNFWAQICPPTIAEYLPSVSSWSVSCPMCNVLGRSQENLKTWPLTFVMSRDCRTNWMLLNADWNSGNAIWRSECVSFYK